MKKANALDLLRQFDFKGLFLNELGWDDHEGSLPLKVAEETVALTAVAEKRGMAAYLCTMPGHGKSYDYQTRCRIEIQLAKSVREHLVIYIDADRRFQTWQWVKREPGRPIARREHTYTVGQSGEALLQKLEALEVKIEEEEVLTLVGITAQARKAFDVDRVTKRFYDCFKTEHAAFLKQIEGIDDKDDCEWYASIMLNRLQFVYFIQKKGFLDRDNNYLRNRLTMVQKTRPKTKFLSFYRAFLLKLFHDGLGREERTPELRQLLGTVPYLNGGIFAIHPLEEKHAGIDIPDKAFEKVFAFFDQYRWHLDERPLRADDEINPDVLGFIFEKYINQKQMGAYYTKEDITEYIAKNCIVPVILDRTQADLKKKGKDSAFSALFQLPAADPDRYIYDPVKHGVALTLPPEIEKGVDTKKPNLMERRVGWNKPAPSEFALPTEIWREVVTRRQRYAEIKSQIGNPKSAMSVNDLITLNLNIRQFAQDCIENAATPEVLWAFWRAIEEITVLDPTCGSGAFLFAAVNVLEPLYEACLDRMKAFMLEWSKAQKVPHPNFYKDFAAVIARVEKHANEKYFIFKSIIIRNLYGVDIMDEAVEICKLRLFLKLAAQIEPNYDEDNLGIEPLPDIDFNIRAGNTLVGFATEKQAEKIISQDLLAYNTVWPEVQRDAKEIAELFSLFRQQQTEIGGAVAAEDKADLRRKLAPLEARLNAYLAETYGVTKKGAVKDWVHSHKPFHWFIEFYEIIAKGGFDTIIGNPPYVNTKKVEYGFDSSFSCALCGDLFALCVERCGTFTRHGGRNGLIIPLSATSTDTMAPLKKFIFRTSTAVWASYFSASDQPASLFTGVRHRLMILLAEKAPSTLPLIYTTRFLKWFTEERPSLFYSFIQYARPDRAVSDPFCKVSSLTGLSILTKLHGRPTLARAIRDTGARIYYHNAPVHWGKVFDFIPHFRVGHGAPQQSSHVKTLALENKATAEIVLCLLNSSFFYWFNWQYSNCRDLSRKDILRVPIDLQSILSESASDFSELATRLMRDYRKHKTLYSRVVDNVTTEFDSFYPARSKPIIDEIDRVLAKHYGFTDEELDFIINYDIKYRMGRDDGEEDVVE